MPLFHVGGLSILMRSVLYGGPVRLQPRFDPAAVSDALDRDDVAGISLVPTMLSRLLEHRGKRLAPASLRVVLLGGAAAAPTLIERALAAGYPVCPTYGLTEATSQVATSAPPTIRKSGRPAAATPTSKADEYSAVPSPMRALAGVELRIASAAREAGEILVRGPVVIKGYLNDPAATTRALRDGWLHTGDIGYVDAQGGLHVLDRRDDLVVTGGENVYPAEVEGVLLEHSAVADAGVTGVPDEDFGARVVAWVVWRPGMKLDAAALAYHCASRLAGYKRPREFRFVDALPRNAAGKLQRRRLTEIEILT
jgi:O-succinylbenzoic acid--CoA ligase